MNQNPIHISSPQNRMPMLDVARGIAVLLVFFHHATLEFPTGISVIDGAGAAAWCGVDLFFALSGFLITGILLDAKGSNRFFRNFFARRFLRIFPLYYGVLGVMVLIATIWPQRLPGLTHLQGWLWAYLSNLKITLSGWCFNFNGIPLNHFWTLAVEEHFYLVWPFVIYLLPQRSIKVVCAVSVGCAIFCRAILMHRYHEIGAAVLTPCRFDAIAVGGLLLLFARDGLSNSKAIFLAGCGAMCVAFLWIYYGQLNYGNWGTSVFGLSVLPLTFAAGLVPLSRMRPTAPLALRAMLPIQMLGKVSYGFYVYHAIVMNAVPFAWLDHSGIAVAGAAFVKAIASFLISLTVSFASWHLFEKRFLRLKRLLLIGQRGSSTQAARAVLISN